MLQEKVFAWMFSIIAAITFQDLLKQEEPCS
jgi:hypothetical protein